MRKALMITAATYVLAGGAASAQDNPLANRPQDPPPIVQYFSSQGLKVTAIGQEGGMSGYLLEKADGKMQTVYVTPDGKHVVVGLLVASGGMNVTALQLDAMKQRFEDAKRQVGQVNGVLASPIQGAPPPGPVPVPQAQPAPPKPDVGKQGAAVGPVPGDLASGTPAPAPSTPGVTVAPLSVASARSDESRSDQWLSTLDKDAFLGKVKATAWFSVGAPRAPGVPAPPELFMVADPQCPFCHHAWETLRPMVVAGKLTLNVILINGLNGSEPKALSLLSRQEPGKAWFAGEGSEDNHPIAPPPAPSSKEYRDARTFLDVNNKFALDMKVQGTPYFAYVSHVNGKLYVGEGPKSLADFLAAL